uniref:Uncharacterized protein n=1 Tax=Ditylenchus dipsaci TaxID=166011 RepID=A0A915DWZ5_9BILA
MSRVPAFILQREANAISEAIALPMTFAFVPIDEDENFFRGNLFDKIRLKDEGTYWLPYYLNKFGFGFNHTISAEDRHNQALISELDYMRAFDALCLILGVHRSLDML